MRTEPWWMSSHVIRDTRAAMWPLLAAACLLLAAVFPWIGVPLVATYRSWDLPLNLGGGAGIPYISYGVVTVAAALGCGAYALACALASRRDGVARPRPSALLALGVLAISPTALFIVQAALIDFRLAMVLADQENESLLIRGSLGYQIAAQRFLMRPFQVQSDSLANRISLLAQLSGFGAVLPLIAGIVLAYGAYAIYHSAPDPHMAPVAASSWGSRWGSRSGGVRRAVHWALIVAGIGAFIILGRASVALISAWQADQALALGDYHSALTLYQRAQWLNPSLLQQPRFRAHRGQALFATGRVHALDARLYEETQIRAVDQAQALVDLSALEEQYPSDPVVRHELVTTLEMRTAGSALNRLLLAQKLNASESASLALSAGEVGVLLPYFGQVMQIEPNDPYAHYVRGRLLFAVRSYEAAGLDFDAILASSSDDDMRSAAYTYLALCRDGVGDFIGARSLLLEAVKFDHGYYNTTAREAISSLH